MKSKFFEYYPISEEDINRIWTNGIFSYDANILLNVFRYSEDARNRVLESIGYFQDRTIMSYQACLEYHKNKRNVTDNLRNCYDEIIQYFNEFVTKLNDGDLSKYRRHCSIDIERDINNPLRSAVKKIEKNISDKRANHDILLNVEELDNRIAELFDGRVSDDFPEDKLNEIYSNGKERYEKKIPPGYADKKNKNENDKRNLYGDLIVWEHLIEISKENDCDIIFITDDNKSDWWEIVNGERKNPRLELYHEFTERTGHRILIYSIDKFVEYAAQHKNKKKASQKVIDEIKDNNVDTSIHWDMSLLTSMQDLIKRSSERYNPDLSLSHIEIPSYLSESLYPNWLKQLGQLPVVTLHDKMQDTFVRPYENIGVKLSDLTSNNMELDVLKNK